MLIPQLWEPAIEAWFHLVMELPVNAVSATKTLKNNKKGDEIQFESRLT